MRKAQGSLEYLIIISVALAVVAIVSLIVVNSFGSQQNRYVYNTCASSAASCKISLSANPDFECSFCDTSCSFANGTSIFPSAVMCCKQGLTSKIYDGSPGCMPSCSDGTPYETCSAAQPEYCSSGSILDSCGAPGNCGCPSDRPVCKSDGTCIATCSGTGCIAGSPPNYCNNNALIKNACGGIYGCLCPGPGTRCFCNGDERCCNDYHYECQVDGTCKKVIDSTDCSGYCGGGGGCTTPPCPI